MLFQSIRRSWLSENLKYGGIVERAMYCQGVRGLEKFDNHWSTVHLLCYTVYGICLLTFRRNEMPPSLKITVHPWYRITSICDHSRLCSSSFLWGKNVSWRNTYQLVSARTAPVTGIIISHIGGWDRCWPGDWGCIPSTNNLWKRADWGYNSEGTCAASVATSSILKYRNRFNAPFSHVRYNIPKSSKLCWHKTQK
jgi:hypothetical protein